MLRKKLFVLASCLTVWGMVLVSCAPAAAPTATPKPTVPSAKVETPSAKPSVAPAAPSPSPKPAAEQARYGGTLKVADRSELRDYDIHQAVSSATVIHPLGPIYNGLLQFDPLGDPNNIVGDLAERWEVSPDGLIYTFHLRKDVKWHDGKPLTSEDVRFSIDRQANPPKGMMSPRKSWFEGMNKIETPDATTVKITLKYPKAVFLSFMASCWSKVLAKHIVEPLGHAKGAKAQIGTGPFMFKEHTAGVQFEVVKNPNYFLKGRPYLDGITLFYIVDGGTRFAAFRTHRINMTGILTYGLTPLQAEIVEKELAGKATVHRFPGMVFVGLSLNTQTAPFNDIRVRKAVSLALDRPKAKGMVDDEFRLGGFLPPGSKWTLPEDELMKLPGYRQPKDADRAEARKLLAEAGYADGLNLQALNRPSGASDFRDQFVQDQLKTVGIQYELQKIDLARHTDALNRHAFTIASFSAGEAIDDPDAWFMTAFHSKGSRNYAQYSDKEVDELLEKQSRILDEKERRDLVTKAHLRVLEFAPAVELYWNWGLMGTWNEVRNWTPGIGVYERTMFQDVWLAQ